MHARLRTGGMGEALYGDAAPKAAAVTASGSWAVLLAAGPSGGGSPKYLRLKNAITNMP